MGADGLMWPLKSIWPAAPMSPAPDAQRFEPVPETQRSAGKPQPVYPDGETVRRLIAEECAALCDLLHGKNKAYANSIFEPMRVFSEASCEESIRMRLDDKLSRLIRGDEAGEDSELDLMGYLILLRVARRLAA